MLVLVSTFLINHFDLFGLRQVWLHLRGKPYTPLRFGTPGLTRSCGTRSTSAGFFAFWATPTMTVAHLFFALATTAYILIAIRLRGARPGGGARRAYSEYREQVPMLVPRLAVVRPGSTRKPT